MKGTEDIAVNNKQKEKVFKVYHDQKNKYFKAFFIAGQRKMLEFS